MISRVVLLAVALTSVVEGRVSRATLRDTPPSIQVTECVPNTDPTIMVAGKQRMSKFVETVVVSGARPDRKVFLSYHAHLSAENEEGAAHVFNSNCGVLKHVGLGVATDLVTDLVRLTSGRKLQVRADGAGEATFTVPTDVCGKMMYQGFDWINNRNCLPTPVANLNYVPPPPVAVSVAPSFVCTRGTGPVSGNEVDGFTSHVAHLSGLTLEAVENIEDAFGTPVGPGNEIDFFNSQPAVFGVDGAKGIYDYDCALQDYLARGVPEGPAISAAQADMGSNDANGDGIVSWAEDFGLIGEPGLVELAP